MNFRGALFGVGLLLGGASIAAGSPFGTWVGRYRCAQGWTALRW